MELNPFAKRYRKGLRRVALVYPNRYVGGIANTGLQYIYAAVNETDFAICERFYADVFDGLRSVETGTPLRDFDIALFSIQYEMDYFKAVDILKKSKFEGLKIAGGPCVMENPKPLLPYFDAFFIGECEDRIEEIICAKSRDELQGIEGIYTGAEDKVKRVYSKLGRHIEQEIIGDGAYGRCFLVEIGRGCVRRCRFCIVRQIYFPPRWRRLDDLPDIIADSGVSKFALIAPSPSDHPKFEEILGKFIEKGFEVSPSSIRADALNEELAELLRAAGVRTLTVAPETAASHLQDILGKGISNDDVIHAAQLACGKFEKIKLYYMVGLPGESFEDVKAIVNQALAVKRYVKRVEVSVNPLVPKPHTPFQWLPFGGVDDIKSGRSLLKRKLEYIYKECRRAGIEADVSGIREFEIQTILSRGDERVSALLEGESIANFRTFLEKIDVDSELPWDFIDHGYRKSRLVEEYLKVFSVT